MSVDNKNTIDELLGVTGIFINSTLFSAQLRKRYYWTNINVDLDIEDRGVELQSILESGYTARKKSVCIVRNYAGSVQSSNKDSFIRMCNARSKKGFLTVVYEEKGNPDSVRLFTQTELERLQTVPVGYTSCVTYQEAADVFNPDDLAYIRDWLKPEMKQCYKNSHLLCEAFPDMVTYCEGKVYSLFPIDHSFNRVGDKYIDITFEFALNDTELTEYEYMVFGDYELEEIERISDETGYYGNYYQYLYRERMRNPRTP